METLSPRIRSLVRQANKVAESGKRSAATKLYRQIIDEAPDTVEAWVGLSTVLRTQEEKEEALQSKSLAQRPSALRDLDVVILSDLVTGDILGLEYERCEHDNLVRYFADPDHTAHGTFNGRTRPSKEGVCGHALKAILKMPNSLICFTKPSGHGCGTIVRKEVPSLR